MEFKNDFKNIDCVVILADHKEFYKIDRNKASKEIRNKIIIDMRNAVEKEKTKGLGMVYKYL